MENVADTRRSSAASPAERTVRIMNLGRDSLLQIALGPAAVHTIVRPRRLPASGPRIA